MWLNCPQNSSNPRALKKLTRPDFLTKAILIASQFIWPARGEKQGIFHLISI